MIYKRTFGILITIAIIIVLGYRGGLLGAQDSAQPGTHAGIPAEKVADIVHAVIQADRTFYTVHVVERLQERGVVVASENWKTQKTLPLPVQFLEESARLAAKTQAKISYRLLSLWPINKRNGPKTEFDQAGLWEVSQHPEHPYTGMVMNGRDLYFQAVYADKAIAQACIGCHNAHPDSPRRNFQLNDVMGAIVISIPMEQ
ncbi:Tll0287-like domain-containing protein [Nitrospira sp. Nam74]